MKPKYVLIALLLLIRFAAFSAAQTANPDMNRTVEKARRMAALGRVEEGLQLLQPLLETNPQDQNLLQAVFEIYRDAKDYEKALNILGRQKNLGRETGSLYLEYADTYLKMAQVDSAAGYFTQYLRISGGGSKAYLDISQTYVKNAYYDKATEIILSARAKLGSATLFALDLGSLYQRQRDYYHATREFFNYLLNDSAGQKLSTNQLDFLIDLNDDYTQVKSALQDIIQEKPQEYLAYRYYAKILVKENKLDSAFIYYKKVDQLYHRDGEYLQRFSRICLDEQSYQMACQASHYLLDNYPDKEYAAIARLNLASAFLRIGEPDSALLIYHEIYRISPDDHNRLEGLYFLAVTFLDELHNVDSARFYLNKLIQDDRTSNWKDRALSKIAKSYIIDGRLKLADSLYLSLNAKRLPSEEAQELLFDRAQIKFFKKEYADARGLYTLLTGVYPRSLLVNDCLRKILLIDENQGLDIIGLDLYAEAEKLLWQYRTDSALQKLANLSNRDSSNLSALATFQTGEIYYQRKDYQRALDNFNKVLASFRESSLGPESQKYLGDLYFYHFNDKERARQAYQTILEKYPNRVLYEYARRQLRKLENS